MPLTLRGDGSVGGATFTPTGVVLPYAGTTEPTGWLFCYGQAVSRTTYADLFTALGTTYGTGDGSTTFNVPDMRGRTVHGKDDMGGSAANRVTNATSGITATTLGATGGNENVHQHTHAFTGTNANTGNQSANHSHTFGTGGISANHSHGQWSLRTSSSTGIASGWENIGIVPRASVGSYWIDYGGGNTGTVSSDHSHSGTTAGISASHSHNITPAGTNADFGSGSSQNMSPTIILNYIIKA